jgi:hypothetical protein
LRLSVFGKDCIHGPVLECTEVRLSVEECRVLPLQDGVGANCERSRDRSWHSAGYERCEAYAGRSRVSVYNTFGCGCEHTVLRGVDWGVRAVVADSAVAIDIIASLLPFLVLLRSHCDENETVLRLCWARRRCSRVQDMRRWRIHVVHRYCRCPLQSRDTAVARRRVCDSDGDLRKWVECRVE